MINIQHQYINGKIAIEKIQQQFFLTKFNDDDFVTINLVELPVVRGSTFILCQAVFVVPSAKMREMENPRTLMMYHIMLCQTQDNIASGVTEVVSSGTNHAFKVK